MKAATLPTQRPRDAKLLIVDAAGGIAHAPRLQLAEHLQPGDLLVANDAATLPASLRGVHGPSRTTIEVRLAGRRSLAVDDVREFTAIVFGAGDHHTRTEDRVAPPPLRAGDALMLGPLRATVLRTLAHPRLVALRFDGTPDAIWAGIARHGKPIQYAHLAEPLALWDVWTQVAALPVAFEPPSAGFVLDWALLGALKRRGIGFATLTHAAGISSTGDAALDARLPFDEPYHLSAATVQAIARTQAMGSRVVALGTTVTRALEHAAARSGGMRAGDGLADQRIVAGERHPRTGDEPLRIAARLRERRGVAARQRGAGSSRLPHTRVRRLGADRAALGDRRFVSAPSPPGCARRCLRSWRAWTRRGGRRSDRRARRTLRARRLT